MRRDVRKLTARLGARLINHTEVFVEEDTGVVFVFQHALQRILGVGQCVLVKGEIGIDSEEDCDGFDFRPAHRDHGLAAAVGAGGAIGLALHLFGNLLEFFDRVMMIVQVAAEGEILFVDDHNYSAYRREGRGGGV